MKRASKPVFFIIAIFILLMSFAAIFGFDGTYGDLPVTYIKGVDDIRWGIDIKGGVEATFSPAGGYDATAEQVEAAKSIIEVRLVKNNITDYELYADHNNDRIIVRFPWKEDETEFNAEEAIKEISATASLTFREGKEYSSMDYDTDGNPVYKTPSGVTASNILVEGKDVEKAEAVVYTDPQTNKTQYMVKLTFNEEGKEKFKNATQQLVGQTMSIWMDDVMISYPTVNQVISDGVATISGDFTSAEASDLASKINAGALPFALETTNFGSINPTLGSSALYAMAIAGVIALSIISIFMILRYRLPGFVACIALLGQVGLSLAAVSGFFSFVPSFTMTLPGVAGIILSMGMGVDANIITAERIKEELNLGKTIDGSISQGCSASFSAIFDGNVTVIIVSLILMSVFGPSNILSFIFGPSTTGVIYSFGYTLLIGVISNFIMGVAASRAMLKSISKFKIFRKKWLYGGKKQNETA